MFVNKNFGGTKGGTLSYVVSFNWHCGGDGKGDNIVLAAPAFAQGGVLGEIKQRLGVHVVSIEARKKPPKYIGGWGSGGKNEGAVKGQLLGS